MNFLHDELFPWKMKVSLLSRGQCCDCRLCREMSWTCERGVQYCQSRGKLEEVSCVAFGGAAEVAMTCKSGERGLLTSSLIIFVPCLFFSFSKEKRAFWQTCVCVTVKLASLGWGLNLELLSLHQWMECELRSRQQLPSQNTKRTLWGKRESRHSEKDKNKKIHLIFFIFDFFSIRGREVPGPVKVRVSRWVTG